MAFTNELETASYSLGVNIGTNLTKQGLKELDVESFKEGLADIFAGSEIKLDSATMNNAIQSLLEKAKGEEAEANKSAGEKFLAETAKKAGVTVLDSGLQYEVLTEGNGKKPGASDTVTTHYHGTLISGEVFDSSVQRGEAATFPVNGVIAGWVEALQLMNEGSKWRLYIPSELAYGPRGAGDMIGPNAALIFEVELIAIK